jgi:CheY-specific phosphatase CheX
MNQFMVMQMRDIVQLGLTDFCRLTKKFKTGNQLTNEDIEMSDFKRDVLIGLMFIVGIFGFISGEFIISTVLFASAAIYSNVAMGKQLS